MVWSNESHARFKHSYFANHAHFNNMLNLFREFNDLSIWRNIISRSQVSEIRLALNTRLYTRLRNIIAISRLEMYYGNLIQEHNQPNFSQASSQL